jgi:hypothetical protein
MEKLKGLLHNRTMEIKNLTKEDSDLAKMILVIVEKLGIR